VHSCEYADLESIHCFLTCGLRLTQCREDVKAADIGYKVRGLDE
jgi:hypothetical protein